jgi:hypothetical protein
MGILSARILGRSSSRTNVSRPAGQKEGWQKNLGQKDEGMKKGFLDYTVSSSFPSSFICPRFFCQPLTDFPPRSSSRFANENREPPEALASSNLRETRGTVQRQ